MGFTRQPSNPHNISKYSANRFKYVKDRRRTFAISRQKPKSQRLTACLVPNNPVGGRLVHFQQFWDQNVTDKLCLSIDNMGYKIQWQDKTSINIKNSDSYNLHVTYPSGGVEFNSMAQFINHSKSQGCLFSRANTTEISDIPVSGEKHTSSSSPLRAPRLFIKMLAQLQQFYANRGSILSLLR